MSGLEVVAATEADRATIASLVQLYLYDMTDEGVWPIGGDGRYEYDLLDRFWQHPYLLRIDGAPAGFALVIGECPLTGEKPCWFMAEFFVMRGYRRQGFGRQAATELLARHPGPWHIAVMQSHARAASFWNTALSNRGVTTRTVQFDDADWHLHAFVANK
jgi:predicted acetyltransferase